ncbi:hypothetical protein J2S13_001232 [Oikeobacillus pervagus]|uniref:Uncharacterized protein n=1 Tax=Oikeobacillus pervagus TaxID=1325931 RepID=A0AAJ1T4U5_9BACI|nr:hypothetical protein [Oikeobacillus pervagus]
MIMNYSIDLYSVRIVFKVKFQPIGELLSI